MSLKNFVSDTPYDKDRAPSKDPTKVSVISRENIKFNIPKNAPISKVMDLRRQKSEINISKADAKALIHEKSHNMLCVKRENRLDIPKVIRACTIMDAVQPAAQKMPKFKLK